MSVGSLIGLVFVILILVVVVLMTIIVVEVLAEIDLAKSHLPDLSDGEMSAWHRYIAYCGRDSMQVLAACKAILERLSQVYHKVHPEQRHLLLCSGYYDQITFLIRRRQRRFAVAFLLLHLWHGGVASLIALRTGKKFSVSELEVLSAGLFMLSLKVPGARFICGVPAFFILRLSLKRMTLHSSAVSTALTAAKCYALTGAMKYLDIIKMLPLDRSTDQGDMLRIAKYLEMTLEELYTLLNC